jgi:DegV family protein with EDD domain
VGVRVVTDSTAYLENEVTRRLDITQVSLSINFPDETFVEMDISNEKFYEILDRSPQFPTSSQPSPNDFYQAFKKIINAGNDIIGIFISSKLSGTFFSALTARSMILEEHPDSRIELIDSNSSAMQLGYAVLNAAKKAREGCTIAEVKSSVLRVMEKTRLYFVPKTLEYLKKGGRVGEAAALLGTLLQIKPILTVTDGKVTVFEKVRTTEKAIGRILSIFEEHFHKYGIAELTVHHINCVEEARKIARHIEEKFGLKAAISPIGPVVGLHVGPGSLGLAYCLLD